MQAPSLSPSLTPTGAPPCLLRALSQTREHTVTRTHKRSRSTSLHVADLPSLSSDERDELASALTELVRRLDALFDAPMPYMLWIHQRPFDGGEWPEARVHVHIAPLLRAPATQRFMAAGELGSGVLFNPVDPTTAAATLRDLAR